MWSKHRRRAFLALCHQGTLPTSKVMLRLVSTVSSLTVPANQTSLTPRLDLNSNLARSPVALRTFPVYLVNYTCIGMNGVAFDALSVAAVLWAHADRD